MSNSSCLFKERGINAVGNEDLGCDMWLVSTDARICEHDIRLCDTSRMFVGKGKLRTWERNLAHCHAVSNNAI